MWVAGVDGCRIGWIAVLMRVDDPTIHRIVTAPTLAAIADAPERPAVIAVDMPIGLPERTEGSGRAPEQLIRPLLGARQSSVFAIPSRRAVEAVDYAEACTIAAATSDPSRKVSRQGFAIFPKIREIDALLIARPELRTRVYESHPEVAFCRLNSEKAMTLPKKIKGAVNPAGMEERKALLCRHGYVRAFLDQKPPTGAAADDFLDAAVMMLIAGRLACGEARPFPDPPLADRFGIPVAIWA